MSDLISKSALIEKFKNSGILDSVDDAWVYSFAIAIIESTPTVESKPVVHGEWIKRDTILKEYYKCSLCGNAEDYRKNFCSSCGADMRGEKND